MKKLLTYFFCTLGIIFFLILCGLAYLWYADPFEIRPVIEGFRTAPSASVSTDAEAAAVVDKNPGLNAEQERALETIGIDPAKLPSEITLEMKICFTEILGAARVAEIEAGGAPTATEVFQTRECYR